MHLPAKLGGAGFTSVRRTVEAAYVAGCVAALQDLRRHVNGNITQADETGVFRAPGIAGLDDALDQLRASSEDMRKMLNKADPLHPADGAVRSSGLQHGLSEALNKQLKERCLAHYRAKPPDQFGRTQAAAMLSCQGPGAAWVGVIPARDASTVLADAQCALAYKRRLGAPLLPEPCACVKCGGTNDPFGHHAFLCPSGEQKGERNRSHTAVKVALKHIVACHPQLSSRMEAKVASFYARKLVGVGADEAATEHRCDIIASAVAGTVFGRDNHLLIDVTVRHPKPDGGGDTQPGSAADAGHKEKLQFYSGRYKVQKEAIIPFSVETFGYLGLAAVALLKHVAEATSGGRASYSRKVRYFYQCIAVAIQRGGAEAVARWLSECVPEAAASQAAGA